MQWDIEYFKKKADEFYENKTKGKDNEEIKSNIIKKIIAKYESIYTPQFCDYLRKEIKIALDEYEQTTI